MSVVENERIEERDSELPGLPLVLNAHRLRDALLAHGSVDEAHTVELNYIRYKPGVRALALLNVCDDPDRQRMLVVTAHNAAGWRKFVETGQCEQATARHGMLLPSLLCSVEWFPYDRQLKQLVKLYTPEKTAKVIHRLLDTDMLPDQQWRLEALTYKPRRRFVAQATCAEQSLTLKCYTREDFDSARCIASMIKPEQFDGLVPQPIGLNAHYSMIALEWLAGETLTSRLGDNDNAKPLLKSAGEMLGRWHELASRSMQSVHRRHDGFTVQSLHQIVEDVSWLLPDLRSPLQRVVHLIDDALRKLASSHDLIHGDFYAKQVIVQTHSLRMIDFDEVGRGHRYQDLGNFIGQLYSDAVRSHLSWNQIERHVEGRVATFLEGYESLAGAIDEPLMNASIVAGMLRCLPHAFRRGMPDWPERMRYMLHLTEQHATPVCASRRSLLPSQKSITSPKEIENECTRYLDTAYIESQLGQTEDQRWGTVRVAQAKLIRYKPAKRLLVEYTLQDTEERSTSRILGKANLRKPVNDRLLILHRELQSLRAAKVIVPEALGVLPNAHMWFQEKLDGQHVLCTEDPASHYCVGAALAELHNCSLELDRRHTVNDELRVLRLQYEQWLLSSITWEPAARKVLELAEELASQLTAVPEALLHRDFYFDQVLVLDEGIGLLDFDLAAMGPPELDVGNYLAHLDEYGMRFSDRASFCSYAAKAFLAGYCARRPHSLSHHIEIWRLLSLSRLAAISQRLADRTSTTSALLKMCFSRQYALRTTVLR